MTHITPEEIDDLPEDPDDAFVAFHRIVSGRYNIIVESARERLMKPKTSGEAAAINDELESAREAFMTLIASAALQYGLANKDEFDITSLSDQDFRRLYRFSLSEATRLSLSSRLRRATVATNINDASKARLRKHLSDLENALENCDLPEPRKKALRAKLAEFGSELEKTNSNIGVMLAAIALVAAALNQSEDLVIKVPKTVEAIFQIIGTAKNEEMRRSILLQHQPDNTQRKAITGPVPPSLETRRGIRVNFR